MCVCVCARACMCVASVPGSLRKGGRREPGTEASMCVYMYVCMLGPLVALQGNKEV